MIKKFFTLSILMSLLMVGGFGCKGLTQEQRAAVRPVTLNYWTIYNDVDQLKKFAADYKKLRPYITVNIRQVRYDEFDRLFTNALADDVEPDIVSMHIQWLRRHQGRLASMPRSVQVARIFKKNQYTDEVEIVIDTNLLPTIRDIRTNYIKTVYDDIIIDNKVYGLPLAADALAIYFNRDLLDRAGIAEVPANWDEFVEAVKKTTKFDNQGNIVQSGAALGTSGNVDASFDILSLFMMQSGVNMATGDYVTFADGLKGADYTHPTLKALRFYTDFAQPTKEVYSWNKDKGNALDEFTRGKVAFYFGYAYDLPRILSRAPHLNIETMPMLQLNVDAPSNIANYWVESVVKKSNNQNEAWDFVRFITSPENVKKYTDATYRPSPLRSQITKQQEDEKLGPFATQALFAENWYRGRDVVITRQAFSEMIDRFLEPYGDIDPLKRDIPLILNTAARVQQTM